MILVVAVAVWLSFTSDSFSSGSVVGSFRVVYDQILQLAGLAPWRMRFSRRVGWLVLHDAALDFLAPWPFLFGCLVPAVLLLGLRRPRPSWHGLVHQAGFSGCLHLACYACVRLPAWWLGRYIDHFASDAPALTVVDAALAVSDAAFAGVLLWVVLGRSPWHADPSWLDRLGRVVAFYWIIVLGLGAADHAVLCCVL